MKNSDMKVIAIILSIALFFTIITSNAVSIASVVMLAKDGGAATEEGATPGTPGAATTPDAGTATTPDAGTATTPDAGTATTPDAGTATTPDAGTATTPDANKPADKPAGNNGGAATSPVDQKALDFYQKAAMNEKKTGAQGFTKIAYQSVEAIDIGKASGILMPILKSFMTDEAKAKEGAKPRTGDDAKGVFPASNFTKAYVKSAKIEDKGGDKVVTIVFNDQGEMTKKDTDGLHVATCWDLLYIEDVKNTVENDAAVKKVVKSLDQGTLVYKNFTIVAVMTKDGKFKSINMDGTGDIVADAKLIIGALHGTGTLGFHVRYYDFTK